MMTEPTTSAIFVGFKIAIFIGLLVLTFLADTVHKKNKTIHGLNIFAIALIIAALAEFFHVVASLHTGILTWLVNHDNLYLITHAFTAVGGLGIIWYLWGINKDIKNYK